MNTSMENRTLNGITKNKVLKIILIAVFALSIIANGVQGYFIYKKIKAYRAQEAIIKNKSNCEKCPAPAKVETPTTTGSTTPSSTRRRNSSSSEESTPEATETPSSSPPADTPAPEPVIPPPPAPSD